MKQKIITAIFVVLIIGLLWVVVSGSKNKKLQTAPVTEQAAVSDTLYWGTTCPHCHDTIKWMEENKIDQKLTVIRKEIYDNRENSIELTQKARTCGIAQEDIKVPFMFTSDAKCLIGTPDIIAYLAQRVQALGQNAEATISAEGIK